ncbi:hypothetical protein [Demequina sp.]|uniref:hypothetical protein n=1 Tax=Demequina sp. TaxID=2050685 RepID=UPI0025D2A4D5|nr:hypothetical protein [Demequina sp.]
MARGFNYAPGASAEVDEAALPGLAKERLTQLGSSKNAVVREAVARREDCPFGIMVTLAHDHVTAVRTAVAANPRVLHSVIEYLSRDRQVEVLLAVLANPAVTPDIVDQLASHRRREVRDGAIAAHESGGAARNIDDAHTPELRDRVFEESRARRDAMLAAVAEQDRAAADEAMESAEPLAEASVLPSRPTRTAPVRGFRPPVDV